MGKVVFWFWTAAHVIKEHRFFLSPTRCRTAIGEPTLAVLFCFGIEVLVLHILIFIFHLLIFAILPRKRFLTKLRLNAAETAAYLKFVWMRAEERNAAVIIYADGAQGAFSSRSAGPSGTADGWRDLQPELLPQRVGRAGGRGSGEASQLQGKVSSPGPLRGSSAMRQDSRMRNVCPTCAPGQNGCFFLPRALRRTSVSLRGKQSIYE